MQEVEFSCTSCRSALSASKSDYGELVQCPECNHTMKVPRYGVVAGMELGDFKVLKCLGVGGMGEVWLAEQGSLQRRVALKILSPDISNDDSFINRFNQEVKIAGKLIHPNIVVAFHAGEQNGIRYLTCAYVDGLVASEALAVNGPMPQAEVLKIGRDIAKGLKYAWEKAHILHRDVKPDNIMLAKDGTPMLMDMGISKNFDEDVSLTMTGEIIGTPHYISPEQAHAAEDIDFRSDQYSLGATLFHLLTGQLPYQATSAMGILAQHLQDPVPDAREFNSEISIECSKMIHKMMAKKPEDRYQSWDEFIVNANSLLPPQLRDGTMLPGALMAPKKSSSTPIIIGALAGVIVIALLLSAFVTMKYFNNNNNQNQNIAQVPPDSTNTFPAKIGPDKPEVVYEPTIADAPPETDRPPTRRPKGPGKDSDKKKHNDSIDFSQPRLNSKFQEVTAKLKTKFPISDSDAEKLGEKILVHRMLTHGIRISDQTTEDAHKELIKTAEEIFGHDKLGKFKEFLRNSSVRGGAGGKPNKTFRGIRRR